MLDALKFVQGSVAKKELVEGLTSFLIRDGQVQGFNGVIALGSPIELDIDCKPEAGPMIKAISNCDETVQLTMMANGKLNIKSGPFRVAIRCIDKETPHVFPEGDLYEIDGARFVHGVKSVAPFVGSDASRPWACGILINNGSLFATNNVTIAEYWFGNQFPIDCIIPSVAIKEILRIKANPTHIQVSKNNVTFHYPEGRWLRTQLIDAEWPDIRRILNVQCNAHPVDPGLFEGLHKIKPFAEDRPRVYIENGLARTHYDDAEGASFVLQDRSITGVYNIDILLLLENVVKTADFSLYPRPCAFFGENLRGVLIGERV